MKKHLVFLLLLCYLVLPHEAFAIRTAIVKPPNNLGLAGYWPMNEGTSTLADDYSGNNNDGTLSTTGSALPAWSTGKFGGALYFNGANQYVTTPGLNNAINYSAITVSAWVYVNSVGVNPRFVTNSHTDADNKGFQLGYGTSPNPCPHQNSNGFFFDVGNGSASACSDSNSTIVFNTWYHLVGTYDGTTVRLYVNNVAQSGTGSLTGSVSPQTSDLVFGRGVYGSDYANATIDDVRLYKRALSAAEVGNLYVQGAARVVASSKTLTNGSSLNQGLVGLWTFDGGDINWTSATAGVAYDGSGNNNIGTLTNMTRAASVAIGKLGQALSFDGSSSYVSVGNVGTVRTVSFWMKPTVSASKKIIDLNGTAQIETNGSSQITATSFPAATVYVDGVVASTVDTGWHFVTVTDSTGVTASAMNIGRVSASYYLGLLDDARIYNRILSATEVKQLYLLGGAKIKP